VTTGSTARATSHIRAALPAYQSAAAPTADALSHTLASNRSSAAAMPVDVRTSHSPQAAHFVASARTAEQQ
jgi:hypothetical protein